MLRRVVVAVLAIALLSSVSVGVISAQGGGQEKVVVCHKPGTADEKTLEIAAPALDAHLAHGDTEGACPLPSDGCAALNAAVPDPQVDPFYFYYFGVRDLEFDPGEVIHVEITVTANAENSSLVYASAGIFGSDGYPILRYLQPVEPGLTETAWIVGDYTVVEGVGVSGAFVTAYPIPGGDTFTLDAVHFSCTPN